MNFKDEVYVYYSFIDPEMQDERLMNYLHQLPPGLWKDIVKYRQKADQVRSLTGKLLLREAIQEAGLDAGLMNSIAYTDFKRPYIAEHFDFNITHSGNCVALALGYDMRLGIDVEQVTPISPDDILTVLRPDELDEMRRTNADADTVLRFWTRKEAIVKASGEGLYRQPQEIYFQDSLTAQTADTAWFLQEIELGSDYICYYAANVSGKKTVIRRVEY
ncbi:MAG: 4'-phosphopantetheinyl transferase superfamily protein [Chitinophagaceae bacterium]